MKDLKEAYKTIEARGFHPLTPKSAALGFGHMHCPQGTDEVGR